MIEAYEVKEINTFRELKEIMSGEEEAWLFLSTQGKHGTYLSLDDVESIIRDENEFTESVHGKYWITILVILPRLASGTVLNIGWGELLVDLDNLQWLRERVRETIEKINVSQYGNF